MQRIEQSRSPHDCVVTVTVSDGIGARHGSLIDNLVLAAGPKLILACDYDRDPALHIISPP